MWQDVVVEQLPKALVGLAVPAAQFIWKQFRESTAEQKKSRLRSRVAELAAQRRAFAELDSTPSSAQARLDLERELDAAVSSLARFGAGPPVHVPPPPSRRSRVANALLLYAPSGLGGWIVHVGFWLIVAMLFFGTIGILSDTQDPDAGGALIAMAFFTIPAVLLWRTARRMTGGARARARRTKTYRFAVALFWYALISIPLWAVAPFLDEPDPFSASSLRFAVPFIAVSIAGLGLLASAARGWSRSLASTDDGAAAPQQQAWLATAALAVAVVGALATLAYFLRMPELDEDAAPAMVMLLLHLGLLATAGYGWRRASRHRGDARRHATIDA